MQINTAERRDEEVQVLGGWTFSFDAFGRLESSLGSYGGVILITVV
jgi:hypothetical protein